MFGEDGYSWQQLHDLSVTGGGPVKSGVCWMHVSPSGGGCKYKITIFVMFPTAGVYHEGSDIKDVYSCLLLCTMQAVYFLEEKKIIC